MFSLASQNYKNLSYFFSLITQYSIARQEHVILQTILKY